MISAICAATTRVNPGIFAGGAMGTGGRTINPQTQLNQLPSTNNVISTSDRMPPGYASLLTNTAGAAFRASQALKETSNYNLAV